MQRKQESLQQFTKRKCQIYCTNEWNVACHVKRMRRYILTAIFCSASSSQHLHSTLQRTNKNLPPPPTQRKKKQHNLWNILLRLIAHPAASQTLTHFLMNIFRLVLRATLTTPICQVRRLSTWIMVTYVREYNHQRRWWLQRMEARNKTMRTDHTINIHVCVAV